MTVMLNYSTVASDTHVKYGTWATCFIVHPAVCTSGALDKQPHPLSLKW
jgi:hypothetical protein